VAFGIVRSDVAGVVADEVDLVFFENGPLDQTDFSLLVSSAYLSSCSPFPY
jgi:hypothetical protein